MIKAFVILRTVLLEVEAQVEKRVFQNAVEAEEQRDQQSSDPTVAIEKGMNGFELSVRQSRFHDPLDADRIIMEKPFEIAHGVRNVLRRGRNEMCVRRTRASYPVLGTTKLARLLVRSSSSREQARVHFG